MRLTQILSKLETKAAVTPLTFVVAEAEVALPASRVDDCDERVDVRAARPTPHDRVTLNDRQILKREKKYIR